MQSTLQNAKLSWNDAGTPISDSFGDVYFSNDNGLLETRYVFLNQNNLPARWQTHDRDLFVIAETGFGTGLNFLATWQAFKQYQETTTHKKVSRLHFISFEKYPLTQSDLKQALTAWPELAQLSEKLVNAYPYIVPGCQRVRFDNGSVVLDLWLGDVNELIPQVFSPADGLVDAWYLDGFAPSKNPDMWTDNLFKHLYRLIRPQGTLATFTAAGFVRRGLADAGFAMSKISGYGKKREMLTGLSQKTLSSVSADRQSFSIVGGGIASACLSYLLTQRGYQVDLFCADTHVAQGASGNPQGAIYPLLHQPNDELSQFFTTAFAFCRQLIEEINATEAIPHDWCGVLLKAIDCKSAQKIQVLLDAGFPQELIHSTEGGAMMPDAGWISPVQLTEVLFKLASGTGLFSLHINSKITSFNKTGNGWRLITEDQRCLDATRLILANGADIGMFNQTAELPVTPVRGQISLIKPSENTDTPHIICADGYVVPAYENQQVIGASYIRHDKDRSVRANEHLDNITKLQNTLAADVATDVLGGRASIRGVTRDHLPLVGGLRNQNTLAETLTHMTATGWLPAENSGLYILAGFGSRGLCSAPLAAEFLANLLLNEPIPCSLNIIRNLDPQRRWLKPHWRKIRVNQ